VARPNLNVVTAPKFVGKAEVQARYDNASEMTINRWMGNPEVAFPRPIKFMKGGKNFWLLEELNAFDERMAAAPRKPGRRPGQPRRDPADLRQLDIEGLVTPASASPAETDPTLKR
jgi:hypothetical protein